MMIANARQNDVSALAYPQPKGGRKGAARSVGDVEARRLALS